MRARLLQPALVGQALNFFERMLLRAFTSTGVDGVPLFGTADFPSACLTGSMFLSVFGDGISSTGLSGGLSGAFCSCRAPGAFGCATSDVSGRVFFGLSIMIELLRTRTSSTGGGSRQTTRGRAASAIGREHVPLRAPANASVPLASGGVDESSEASGNKMRHGAGIPNHGAYI